MKIIQIGSYPLSTKLIRGGVEASIYGISKELSYENEVVVIDLPRINIKQDYQEKIDDVEVYRFKNHQKNNRHAVKRLTDILSLIDELKPDVCHIHGTNLTEYKLFKKLQSKGYKVGLTVHGLAHIEKSNIWKKKKSLHNLIKYIYASYIEFRLISKAKSIIVDTEYVKLAIEEYKQRHKIKVLPKFYVIPQGIDTSYFSLKSRNSRGEYHLVSIGAINERKGQLKLLEAFVKAYQSCPDLKLTIAGIKSNEIYYNQVEQAIASKNLQDAISLKVNLSFKEIQELYTNSSVFVLHTQEESQGIVFCEAMAAGLPIISTTVGGVPYVVENNVNGLLSAYGDVDTFAQNIIKLTRDDSLRETIIKNNLQDAQSYNWSTIAQDVVRYYHSI